MRKRIMMRQNVMVVLIQLTWSTTILAGTVNMTSAEQQVGGEIGYMIGEVKHVAIERLVPELPKSLGDADLYAFMAQSDYCFSASASLTSLFDEAQLAVNGSTTVSSEWITPPSGSDDVHGGTGSSFLLYFSTGPLPTQFHIEGQISVDIVSYPSLHPEETFTYLKLSSSDANVTTTIWEESLDGTDIETLVTIDHNEWLLTNKNYILEAFAESGTVSSLTFPNSKSRIASFYFTSTFVTDPSCTQSIPGDWNNDCKVDMVDIGIVANHWLECNLDPPTNCWE